MRKSSHEKIEEQVKIEEKETIIKRKECRKECPGQLHGFAVAKPATIPCVLALALTKCKFSDNLNVCFPLDSSCSLVQFLVR